ncbi:MAG: hypothetical protein AAF533_12915 [Acidobacteriota bacterium]
MSFFKKLFGGDRPRPEWLSLEADELVFEGERGGVGVWRFEDGDAVGIYLFDIEPDLPRGHSDVAGFLGAHREGIASSGATLLESDLLRRHELPMLRTVVSIPQEPSGRSFLGALTLPFRDFSFVVKVQCAEHGMTGMREAILYDRSLAQADEETGEAAPFDPHDPMHDVEFPDHPLSRARRHLAKVETNLRVAPELHDSAPFGLPE